MWVPDFSPQSFSLGLCKMGTQYQPSQRLRKSLRMQLSRKEASLLARRRRGRCELAALQKSLRTWPPSHHCRHLNAAHAARVVLVVKNPPANAGDAGSISGSGRSPGGGHCNPLQDSCLEDPMDRGAWRAIVHGVAESWTRLTRLSTNAQGGSGDRVLWSLLCGSFVSTNVWG